MWVKNVYGQNEGQLQKEWHSSAMRAVHILYEAWQRLVQLKGRWKSATMSLVHIFCTCFFSILSPWVPSLFASESSVVLSGHRNSWKIALMWLKAATPIYKLLLSSKSWLNEVNLHFKIRPREDDMDSLAGSLWRQVGNRKSCVLCTLKSTSQLLKLWIVIWT